MADLLFLVDGSWSVGKANFKHIRALVSATASAFQIGQDRTRVGVVQYSSDARVEFALDAHPTRPALLRAISALPYKGGDTRTGSFSLAWMVLFWNKSMAQTVSFLHFSIPRIRPELPPGKFSHRKIWFPQGFPQGGGGADRRPIRGSS